MGVGIFTKYAKPVLGGALVLLMLAVAGMLYHQFRSPVGGRSPYETVNALYGQEQVAFTIEQSAYPSETESVQVTIRNDAEDTVVAPVLPCRHEWLLEMQVDGVWHSMRLKPECTEKYVKWEFPAEEYGLNSAPSGIVNWNGGEQRYLCNLAKYYRSPLKVGRYRIVFPEMEHVNTGALAVEFVVDR